MSFTWPDHFRDDLVAPAFGSGKLSAYVICTEAWRRGLTVTVKHPRWMYYEVSDGQKSIGFNYSRPSSITTAEAYDSVEDKFQTTSLLREAGAPVPVSRLFNPKEATLEEVAAAAREIGYPVVLKPVRGSVGSGVYANIPHEGQLRETYAHLTQSHAGRDILLEEHFFGDDYRVYVSGARAVAVCHRVPANVIGDGEQTVEELIREKNGIRRRNPFLSRGLIRKDYEINGMLQSCGYTYASIPAAGEYIQLRQKANASAGGDVIDVTDSIPDVIKEAAVRAVGAVSGLPAAGVDVLYNSDAADPAASFRIIEMNSRAHIGVNMYPTHGDGRDVPNAVLNTYFPEVPRRRDSQQLARVAPNFEAITQALKSGAVEEVTLTRLPNREFTVQPHYELPELAHARYDRFAESARVLARKYHLYGELDLSGDVPSMLMAGNGRMMLRFRKELESAFGLNFRKLATNADAPVYSGFTVVR